MSILRVLTKPIPDKIYLQLLYFKHFHRRIDFKTPKTFNEKIQWLKINDRRPEYTIMVDKYLVKDYVAKIIGEEHIIPTLGVWEKAEYIDFDLLPRQFVLKCNNDSGGIVICKDKNSLNREETVSFLSSRLKNNGFWYGREWPYKNVKPCIIAEEYMEDCETNELRDYKFFAFDGEVKALFIASNRQNHILETTFDFFDMDFKHLPLTNGHPNSDNNIEKPKCFNQMKHFASKLSEGIPHVRVDFYEVNGKVYFGELTFHHWSGLVPFNPPEWDTVFGEWIKI